MKKVLVIGSGGAGKSTFAEQLFARTGLPLIHLDALYWRPGWEETPKAEWMSLIGRIVGEPEWIMDGNYGGTLDQRLEACDTAILLDTSPWRCLWRVVGRRIRHGGKSRPGLAAGCHERLDATFSLVDCDLPGHAASRYSGQARRDGALRKDGGHPA
jgi:adenylate kinase family enzyme